MNDTLRRLPRPLGGAFSVSPASSGCAPLATGYPLLHLRCALSSAPVCAMSGDISESLLCLGWPAAYEGQAGMPALQHRVAGCVVDDCPHITRERWASNAMWREQLRRLRGVVGLLEEKVRHS